MAVERGTTDVKILCHNLILSVQQGECVILNTVCWFLTIFQAEEELLVLQQLLYGVQANVDGVHINQRLQDIGAQPSGTTGCFSVVEDP